MSDTSACSISDTLGSNELRKSKRAVRSAP